MIVRVQPKPRDQKLARIAGGGLVALLVSGVVELGPVVILPWMVLTTLTLAVACN